MPSNVLTLGNSTKDNAMAGFRQLANLETNRERTNAEIAFKNDEMKKQKTASTVGTTVTGAAAGAMIGAEYGSVGGPWGAAAGAVGGFLASSLF